MNNLLLSITNCNKECFFDRYTDTEYKNEYWSQEQIKSIRPLAWIPENPKVLLISQAPSLQAWLNNYENTNSNGLVDPNNDFFVNNVLPIFGLDKENIQTFNDNVMWIQSCNCYPWFRFSKNRRSDKCPNNGEVRRCLGQWINDILIITTIKGIVLMGKTSTYLFPEINPNKLSFTELVKKKKFRQDIIMGKEIIPIFHQSKKSRTFNLEPNKIANNEIIDSIRNRFNVWIK